MVNLTTHELRLIAEKRNIKDYKKMSREKLLRTFEESERFIENLSQNGYKRFAKIQNLSQNEIKQIKKMQNLSRNKLEQTTKKRSIKKYKNMSKEGLLISLSTSGQSIDELRKSNNNNAEIKEIKETFNALRNNKLKKKKKWKKLDKIFII